MQFLSMLFVSCSLLALSPLIVSGETCPTKCNTSCTTRVVQSLVQKGNYDVIVSLLQNASGSTVCDVVACLNDETIVGTLLFTAAKAGQQELVLNILECVCDTDRCKRNLTPYLDPAPDFNPPLLSLCLVLKNALVPAFRDVCCNPDSVAVDLLVNSVYTVGSYGAYAAYGNSCDACTVLGCALALAAKQGQAVNDIVLLMEQHVLEQGLEAYEALICCFMTAIQDEILGIGANALPTFLAAFLYITDPSLKLAAVGGICACIDATGNLALGSATIGAINILNGILTAVENNQSIPASANYVLQQIALSGFVFNPVNFVSQTSAVISQFLSCPPDCFKAVFAQATADNVNFIASIICAGNPDVYDCSGYLIPQLQALFGNINTSVLAQATALASITCPTPAYVPPFHLEDLCNENPTQVALFVSQVIGAYEALKATHPGQVAQIQALEDAFVAAVNEAEANCYFPPLLTQGNCQKIATALATSQPGGVEAACDIFSQIKSTSLNNGDTYCKNLCDALTCLRCTPVVGNDGIISMLVCMLSAPDSAYNNCQARGEEIITALCGCGNENEWTDVVSAVLTRLNNMNANLPVNALTRQCSDITF